VKRRAFIVLVVLAAFSFPRFVPAAKKDKLPRLPGAALLMGYPPYDLAMTVEDKTLKLQQRHGDDWRVEPSISADGRMIASARPIPGERSDDKPRLTVSTYSMNDNKWTEYKGLEVFGGSIAISPDGSELAYVTTGTDSPRSRLHIFDIATGKSTLGPEQPQGFFAHIFWSPDGRYIAFDV